MKNNNSYSELEHLELVARRIAESGIDITSQYKDWITVTLACASVGESAREAYHTICSQYSGYDRKQCDEKFDNCLHTGRGDVRLASLMQLAKDCGVDISLPRGARQKTASQKQKERENRIQQMRELNLRGFHGRQYNSNSIGKAMKKIGFESKTIRGINKYLVTKVNTDERNRNNKEEAKEFIPEIF